MNDIRDFTLADVLKDINGLEFQSMHDRNQVYNYMESIVIVMKWSYAKQEFDNDIIKESQSQDMAVIDYLVESYNRRFKN
ncbi:hypothetical protein KY313_01200 [Candidatus Woesearchaeota archaeon]|jgi:hypothetical protein|nr:hypothetical protein [Candidatus Woesearchaeota archaeon]